MERKLAAILSADVQGYSRLMGADEVGTVRTLTAYREMMASLIREHRGRVVDSPGDNLLAEFASVVDAVECAVEVQQELKARNAGLPGDRRMEFRIGINLGDVIVEGERIYGDGVNISARVQALADGGGICISGTAYDQIEGKLALGYESLGEHAVKNIAKPVRVYRVRSEPGAVPILAIRRKHAGRSRWRKVGVTLLLLLLLGVGGVAIWRSVLAPSSPPAPSSPALTLPERPSIAVLPFANLSGDSAQEYFSDGITEDLITGLSKLSGLFVIARNSTFTYKGRAVKVREVGRELGVRYVLEGSVQRAATRVRITAQLVDASTGYHVWAERYDRELKDIFTLQDEITQRIVAALKVKLAEGEQGRLGRKYTDNLEAYDYFLRGLEQVRRTTREANARARRLFERAIELDPKFSAAYAFLGFTHWQEWTLQWSQDSKVLERALQLAQKAIALDESLPEAHRVLGLIYLWQKQHERAIAEAERIIALAPNDSDGYELLGEILTWAGNPERGIELVRKAMRLDPRYPFYYSWSLGHAYRLMGRHEEAIRAQKDVLTQNPQFVAAHAELAILYAELGRQEDARAALAEAGRLSPQASRASLRQSLPYKDPAAVERYLDGLRKAGLE